LDSVRAVVMELSVVPPFCAVWMSTHAWPKAADIPAVGDRLSGGVDSSVHVSSLHSHAASSKQVLSSHCGELRMHVAPWSQQSQGNSEQPAHSRQALSPAQLESEVQHWPLSTFTHRPLSGSTLSSVQGSKSLHRSAASGSMTQHGCNVQSLRQSS